MKVGYGRQFKKQYKKLPQPVREKFDARLILFFQNPRDQILHIHKLHGTFADCYSMNVTGDIRAVFVQVETDTIEFIAIGSHSELYS